MPVAYRLATLAHFDAVSALEARIIQAQGRYALPVADTFSTALSAGGEGRCAFDGDTLIGAAWLRPSATVADYIGLALPNFAPVEAELLHWAQAWASERALTLQVRCEINTPERHTLYRQHNLTEYVHEEIMAFSMAQAVPTSAAYPPELTSATWTSATHAAFYAAYVDSFRERFTNPPRPMAEWVNDTEADADFRPDLSRVLLHQAQAVAYVLAFVEAAPNYRGERIAWVTQVGVIPAWRRHGLASLLMVDLLQAYQQEGYHTALLHVHVNNQSAVSAYLRLGFTFVGRRGRYR